MISLYAPCPHRVEEKLQLASIIVKQASQNIMDVRKGKGIPVAALLQMHGSGSCGIRFFVVCERRSEK